MESAVETGHLRISAGRLLAERLMPAWLQALHAEYPDTRVALKVSSADEAVIAHVRSGEADLGFIGGPRLPDDLHARPIGRDRLIVVTHPGHPWARRETPLSGRDLATTRLLLRTPGSAGRTIVELALAPWGGPRRPARESDHTSVLRHEALRGTAPAILSALAVPGELADGRLVEIAIDPAVRLDRTLHAIWPHGTELSAPAHHLLDLSSALLSR
jgi:DNA-binding transcriptional LysR family regulator